MKIVHIIPGLGRGGAERLVVDTVKALQLKGHDVRLVTFYSKNDYLKDCLDLVLVIIPVKVNVSLVRKNRTDVKELQFFLEDCQQNRRNHQPK